MISNSTCSQIGHRDGDRASGRRAITLQICRVGLPDFRGMLYIGAAGSKAHPSKPAGAGGAPTGRTAAVHARRSAGALPAAPGLRPFGALQFSTTQLRPGALPDHRHFSSLGRCGLARYWFRRCWEKLVPLWDR